MTRRRCECPAWLDADACDEWRRLEVAGVLRRADPATAAAYCFTQSLWIRMRALVDRLENEGSTSWITRDGQQRPHPALAVETRLAAELRELSEALDLEPAGREAPKPSRVIFLDEGI